MKMILSTDWHHGNAGDSVIHNQDLVDFTDWMCNYAEENEISTFVHLGDFFHNRAKLDLNTIEYANETVSRITNTFESTYMLKGNHDIYFRDNRDVCSTHMFKPYVTEVVDYYKIIGDVMLVSWLCTPEEYDDIIKISKEKKVKYMMGHFEFSNFQLNDHYIMESGQSHRELKHLDVVFSGHYHGRQFTDNVVYIGNPLPFDFNDDNDPNKGFCVFDTDTGKYEFVNYEKVHVLTLTPAEILETDWSQFDLNDVTVRVVVEDDVSRETLDTISAILEDNDFRTNKLVYKPKTDNKVIAEVTDINHLMSIDEAVVTHIKGMTDNESINKDLLEELYQEIL